MNTYRERLEGLLLEVNNCYMQLQTNQREYFEASELALKAKEKLEVKKVMSLYDGTITGKNTDEREGAARTIFPELFVAYGEAHDKELGAKFLLDSSIVTVELSRARLRIFELLVKGLENNG